MRSPTQPRSRGPRSHARRAAVHLGTALLTAAALLVSAAPAQGLVPTPNDTWPDAKRLRVGDSLTQDTRSATIQRLDRRLNENCGAPRVGASVWFKVRTARTRQLVVSAAGSDYPVGLMVFRGRPRLESFIGCAPMETGFRARAGRRYFVMAFADNRSRGGELQISLDRVRQPSLDIELDPTAMLEDDGTITVTGTVRCTNASFASVDATLRQLVGRFYVLGFSFSELSGSCDGTAQRLVMTVESDNGILGLEPATVDVFASACSALRCAEAVIEDHALVVQPAP